MTFQRMISTALLTLAAASISLAQGLVWESATTSPMLKQQTLHSVFSYMPGMLRQASQENGTATVFRLDRKRIYMINERNKTYSEMTFDEIESAMKKKGADLDKKMGDMQKKLKDMPEEQRRMMEKALGGSMPGADGETQVAVTKTAGTKTISGFACAEYVIRQGEKTVMTIWATKDVPGYAGMQKELQDFGRRMAAMNPAAGKSMAQAMKQVDGFPIQTEMGETLTTTVVKVETKATPRGAFDVPSGYQKTASPYLQP